MRLREAGTTQGAQPAAWSRWSSSGPVLQFLLVAGGFWLAALILWEVGRWDLAVASTAAGAGLPLIILAVSVRARPRLWALRLAMDAGEIEAAVRTFVGAPNLEVVAVADLPRGHPLRRCERVFRVARPHCLLGWSVPEGRPHPATPARPAILLVLPRAEGPDMDRFRDDLARSLAA